MLWKLSIFFQKFTHVESLYGTLLDVRDIKFRSMMMHGHIFFYPYRELMLKHIQVHQEKYQTLHNIFTH